MTCDPAAAGVHRTKEAGASGGPQPRRRPRAHQQLHRVVKRRRVGGRQLRPAGAGIGRDEDTGAAHRIDVAEALAGTRVDGVAVGRVEGQRDDGEVGHQVGERQPAVTGVGGLPDPSGDAAGIHDVRVDRVDQQRAGSPALVGGPERRPGAQQVDAVRRQRAAGRAFARQPEAERARVARHVAHLGHGGEVGRRVQRPGAGGQRGTSRQQGAGAAVGVERGGLVRKAERRQSAAAEFAVEPGALFRPEWKARALRVGGHQAAGEHGGGRERKRDGQASPGHRG
jgi:hypothetical protein